MKSNRRANLEQELDIALTFPDIVKERRNLTNEEFETYLKELQDGIQASKQGKRSRDKGNEYERKIAKRFNKALGTVLVRTPLSGGFHKSTESDFKGDLTNLDPYTNFMLHLECKNQKSLRLKEWLHQAKEESQNKIPCVVFHQHQEGKYKAQDYVVIALEDFLSIIDAKEIVHDKPKSNKRIKRKNPK